MDDYDWTSEETWRRRINGITLAVRVVPFGKKWAWSANRYPDVHERGKADTLLQAMAEASFVANPAK